MATPKGCGEGYGAITENNDPDEEQTLISSSKQGNGNGSPTSPRVESDGSVTSPALIVIYGLINTIMCIPCLYGYASVIFNNEAFQPHISSLSKLVLFSSIVHQICFTIFSSLPFSIGQVQDAGLIFLSHMANIIANSIKEKGGGRLRNSLDLDCPTRHWHMLSRSSACHYGKVPPCRRCELLVSF
jgi:hypothetical protein